MISLTAKATKTELDWVKRIKEVHANPNYPQTWGIDISIEEFVRIILKNC